MKPRTGGGRGGDASEALCDACLTRQLLWQQQRGKVVAERRRIIRRALQNTKKKKRETQKERERNREREREREGEGEGQREREGE